MSGGTLRYTSAECPGGHCTLVQNVRGTLYTSAKRPGGQILGGTLGTKTPALLERRFFPIKAFMDPFPTFCMYTFNFDSTNPVCWVKDTSILLNKIETLESFYGEILYDQYMLYKRFRAQLD